MLMIYLKQANARLEWIGPRHLGFVGRPTHDELHQLHSALRSAAAQMVEDGWWPTAGQLVARGAGQGAGQDAGQPAEPQGTAALSTPSALQLQIFGEIAADVGRRLATAAWSQLPTARAA